MGGQNSKESTRVRTFTNPHKDIFLLNSPEMYYEDDKFLYIFRKVQVEDLCFGLRMMNDGKFYQINDMKIDAGRYYIWLTNIKKTADNDIILINHDPSEYVWMLYQKTSL